MITFRSLLLSLALLSVSAAAQQPQASQPDAATDSNTTPLTLFPHPDSARYLLSGQTHHQSTL